MPARVLGSRCGDSLEPQEHVKKQRFRLQKLRNPEPFNVYIADLVTMWKSSSEGDLTAAGCLKPLLRFYYSHVFGKHSLLFFRGHTWWMWEGNNDKRLCNHWDAPVLCERGCMCVGSVDAVSRTLSRGGFGPVDHTWQRQAYREPLIASYHVRHPTRLRLHLWRLCLLQSSCRLWRFPCRDRSLIVTFVNEWSEHEW